MASRIDVDLLDRKLEEVKRLDYRITHADRLKSLITNQPDEALYRMNLVRIAADWGVDPKSVIPLFLWGTKVGLLDLNWEIHCPMCNGVTAHHEGMHAMTSESYCGNCKAGFQCELDTGIEVTFTVNGNIRALNVSDASPSMASASERLNGFDIVNSPIFRRFFSKEVLSEHESLSVKHVAILFTDLKGSTKMYQDLGDAKAFKIVKQHFDILEEEIHAHHGVIVKTIGDAVMASFGKTGDAIGAAIAVQRKFREFNAKFNLHDGVSIRIGVHVGPSLMVTLNSRLDYFGTAVNIAARVEAVGDGQEIVITKEVFDDLSVKTQLLEQCSTIKPFTAKLKGIDEEQKLVKLVYQ